jgi:hypothetical protein
LILQLLLAESQGLQAGRGGLEGRPALPRRIGDKGVGNSL